MTILAVVKTGTDLIVAADSKVTTSGLGGIESTTGKPIWLEQTYDFGTKIAFSKGNMWTVAIAGQGAFNDVQISDVVGQFISGRFSSRSEQEEDLYNLVNKLGKIRNSKFKELNLHEDLWPITTLLFFSSDPEGRGVNAWTVVYSSGNPNVGNILQHPGVYIDGSGEHVLTLLYGYCFRAAREIAVALEIPEDNISLAFREKFLPPVSKLNVAIMPIQDAMDFAAFLVKVQIQMERFLPGIPRCGGPIDLAVVRGLPKYEILWYPGKELRHPDSI